MYSKIKIKTYIIIILVLITFILIKYNYQKQFAKNRFLISEIKRNKNMIVKIKQKRKELKTIKNTLKIGANKLNKIKLNLFKSREASETLDNLKKYIFEYLSNKGLEISDYRQVPIKDMKDFYLCSIEVNFRADTRELTEVFDYFSKSNYLIIFNNFNVNYVNSKNKHLRVRIIFSTLHLKKLEEV